MHRFDAQQVEFFRRFSKSPEGHFLIETLQAELGACERALRTSEGAAMHRQQGRAALLDELIANLNGRALPEPTPKATSVSQRMREPVW